MKNKTAGYVVELAYNEFSSAQQRNSMLQEFLGPEYRLFKVSINSWYPDETSPDETSYGFFVPEIL
jgi:hypothetical protein